MEDRGGEEAVKKKTGMGGRGWKWGGGGEEEKEKK